MGEQPPEALAIIAPDYRAAQRVAQEHGLDPQRAGRDWIYVTRGEDVLGRRPGRYASISWDGALIDGAKLDALDWMIRRGWTAADEPADEVDEP